jgi:hypothetical protein
MHHEMLTQRNLFASHQYKGHAESAFCDMYVQVGVLDFEHNVHMHRTTNLKTAVRHPAHAIKDDDLFG